MVKAIFTMFFGVILMPSSAIAFTLNKSIRVPDWMDYYLLVLALGVALSMGFVKLTKPAFVPMNEVYLHAKALSPATNFARFSALVCLGLFFVLFFLGMGLARLA